MRLVSVVKILINLFLKIFNLKITFYSNFKRLSQYHKDSLILRFIKEFSTSKNILRTIKYSSLSKSELLQDLFVLNKLNFKKKGFFVEFGAMDGETDSNTYLLEKKFGWRGILCEPNKKYIKELKKKRKAIIEPMLVWKNSGSELLFKVAANPGLSTIKNYIHSDTHRRKIVNSYYLKTISLNDLLSKYNSPKIIDYLSIDTEGSEYEILKNLNFKKFQFRIITIEHNYVKTKRKLINSLLVKNGYTKYENKFTSVIEEDWYFKK